MKNFLLIFLDCLPALLFSQTVDSFALKTVDSLIGVSRSLLPQNKFDEALQVNEIAKKIAQEKFGEKSLQYSRASFNHGRVLYFKGNYDESERWYLIAKDIRFQILGRENAEYAACLHSLGVVSMHQGAYNNSEKYQLECLDIREKLAGKNNIDYANTMSNLANLYSAMDNDELCERYNLEALAITEKVLGKEHPEYASSLNNLGNLYSNLGSFKKAEAYYMEAKAIYEKTLQTNLPRYAETLNNLAVLLYRNSNRYEESEFYLLKCIAFREKVFGKQNPNYIGNLNNLAVLYGKMGNYSKSEELLKEVIILRESVQGKNNRDYAEALNNLADYYYSQNQLDKAESLYLEAKQIRENVLGKTHKHYADSMRKLAYFYWSSGDLLNSKNYLKQATELEKIYTGKVARYLSEKELNAYIQAFSSALSRDFSFNQLQRNLTDVCYDNLLFQKGFLLSAIAKVNKLAVSDSTTMETYARFKSYQRRLAAEYSKPIVDQKNIDELEEKANAVEKELTRNVAGLGEALQQVRWQEVQQKLQLHEAAIEFVDYRFFNPKPTDSVMYAAFVLLPDAEEPHFVSLFEETQLEVLLKINDKTHMDYLDELYAFEKSGQALYNLLWHPLEKHLAGVKTIYFSPSGLLHRINLGAIPQAPDVTLFDRFQLAELGNTRQLVYPSAIQNVNQNAILFGGLEYEMDSSTVAIAKADLSNNTRKVSHDLGFENADSTLRGGAWKYLNWTKVEVNALNLILKDAHIHPTVFSGLEGTEEAFKNIGTTFPSPRILHLATHGFFYPDSKNIKFQREEASVFKISDHPMIRSGMVLAGGNYAWKTGKSFRLNNEDGILTAYEISQSNLKNTELVVLSACETGLGDIQGNEGVYGLQRAFKIAGAKYLIMSLWQVPDFQTQELMTTFYSNWLEDKMTIPAAFHIAQKSMRDKYKNPFYWAGFVLVE